MSKKFLVFYRNNEATNTMHKCCGSLATIQVDGRLSRNSIKEVAATHAKNNRYDGFQLHYGASIKDMKPLELWVHKV